MKLNKVNRAYDISYKSNYCNLTCRLQADLLTVSQNTNARIIAYCIEIANKVA